MNVSFLSLRSESTVAQRLEIGLTDFTWHSHALCFLHSPFLYFSKLCLYAQDTILFKIFFFLGVGSLLILSHSTQACICLPGRCLSPKEQMVSLQSCSIFMVSQFLPDSMLSGLVAPALLCVFSSFLVPPWELLVKS